MNTIAELKKKRAAIHAEMKSLNAKDTDETPWTDDDKAAYDDLSSRLDAHDTRIERLEALNERDAEEASAVGDDEDEEAVQMSAGKSGPRGVLKSGGTRGPVIRQSRKHEAKGTMMARFIIGAGIAKQNGLAAGEAYVRDQLGDREVAKALASNSQVQGGALVPQDFRDELIELLTATAVVRSLGVDVIPMPFGNLTIPRIDAGATANWVGENLDIPASQEIFGDIQLSGHKLAAIVPVSND